MGQESSNRIVGADAVRAMACLWVFACHISVVDPTLRDMDLPLLRFLFAGAMGVPVFFVLSGFLLSIPFWRALAARQSMPDLRVYARHRLARIVPEYYVCVVVMAIVASSLGSKWGLIQLVGCLTFTNSLIPPTYTPGWNEPLWSIGIEMIFYVLLAVVAFGMFRCRSRHVARAYIIGLIGVIAFAQYVLLLLAPSIERAVGNESLFSAGSSSTTKNAVMLFGHFLVGVVAADVYLGQRGGTGGRCNRYDAAAIMAAVVLAVPIMVGRNMPSLGYMKYQWPTFTILVAVLLVCLPHSGIVGRCLEGRFTRATATLSYGIYMWHTPILRGLKGVWPQTDQGQIKGILLFVLVGLACSYTVASISYHLVGKPVNRWARSRDRGQNKVGKVVIRKQPNILAGGVNVG